MIVALGIEQNHNSGRSQAVGFHLAGGPVGQCLLYPFGRRQNSLHNRYKFKNRQRGYSKMEEATSSRLRCNSGSSVSVQTMATWQARRAGMPSDISRPA